MSKEVKEFEMHRAIKGPSWYIMPIEWILMVVLACIFKRTRVKKVNCKGLKTPYLIFSNHASFQDFPNLVKATSHKGILTRNVWVTSVEEFNGREWWMRHAGCIPKRKYTKDTVLIRNIAKTLQHGKCNVVIYPEARFSLCGVPDDIGSALGKFAKFCKVPVVVFHQYGNFVHSPQWCKHPYRRIRNEVELIQVATKEEVESLSAEELQSRIEKAFIYDDYQWQYDNNLKIKCKKRALNIHKVLYKCPCCKKENMTSYDHFIECKECGAKWDMDVYSRLHLLNPDKTWNEEFSHVPNWYRWERKEVEKEIEEGTYLFEDEVRVESLVNAKLGFVPLGTAHFRQDLDGIKISGTLDDGSEFLMVKDAASTSSIHVEYDFKHRGDAIDIADLEKTFFVFPLNKYNSLTKLHFATETLFKRANRLNNN